MTLLTVLIQLSKHTSMCLYFPFTSFYIDRMVRTKMHFSDTELYNRYINIYRMINFMLSGLYAECH